MNAARVELLFETANADALRAGLARADVNARVDAGEPLVLVVPPFLARDAVARFARRGRAKVHGVVGHPLGWSRPVFKAIEATGLAKENVDAVEVVPLPDVATLTDELREIARGIRAARPGLPMFVRVTPVLLDTLEVTRVEAILRATQHGGADGIVLAGPGDWADEASALVADRAASAGLVCVTAPRR